LTIPPRDDGTSEVRNDLEIKLVSTSHAMKSAIFIEAPHVDPPFDDRAGAANTQTGTVRQLLSKQT
jgi:hypothetical protein